MHHYDFHIGDYMKATAHLSNEEDLCYRRLLDMYYDTEQPIPLDVAWVAKRLRLPVDVVRSVLDDFFIETESGWSNKRCDSYIAVFKGFVEAGKRGAAKRWAKGGDSPPIATLNVPHTEANAPPIPTSNHEPVTSNHVNLEALSGKPDPVPAEVVDKQKDVTDAAKRILEFLNLRSGKRFHPTQSNIAPIVARLREGYSEQDIRTVTMRKVSEWLPDEKMQEYIRPKTLFNATNFNSYAGIL